MNAKNAKSLTAALVLSLAALSTAHAAEAPRVDRIVDLPAVTVRADSAAQDAHLARVVDLPAVTVRPEGALRAELAARTFVAHIIDLPAVTVRPTIEQLAERAAIVAADHAQALSSQLSQKLATEIVSASLD